MFDEAGGDQDIQLRVGQAPNELHSVLPRGERAYALGGVNRMPLVCGLVWLPQWQRTGQSRPDWSSIVAG